MTSSADPQSEPLPTLEGRGLNFGLALEAQQILDLLQARIPNLSGRLGSDDVVVAEEIAGPTEATDAAMAALASSGVTAFVARRFSDAFQRAADRHGIPAIVVDTPSFIHTDDRVRLDLDAAKIVNLSSGDRVAIRNLDDEERVRLRALFGRRARP